MKIKDLAQHLRIAAKNVYEYKKMGMPTDSYESAARWLKKRKEKTKRGRPIKTPPVSKSRITLKNISLENTDPYSILDKLRRSLAIEEHEINEASKQLENARNNPDIEIDYWSGVLARARSAQSDVIKQLLDAQLKVTKLEASRGSLISIEEAKEYITRHIAPVIIQIRKMPDKARNAGERTLLETLAKSLLATLRESANKELDKDKITLTHAEHKRRSQIIEPTLS